MSGCGGNQKHSHLWTGIAQYLPEGKRICFRIMKREDFYEYCHFGSQYGTAEKYAEELSARTGYELKSYEEAGDINAYGTIIYIGALYAGGVMGMKKVFKNMKDPSAHKIVIATVGLADPEDKENTDTIKRGMKNQLPPEVFRNAMIFHLRGRIDYSKLGFKHKTMMSLLYKKAVNLPEEKKTTEVKAMIETYNRQVDFVDMRSLDPIIRAL